MKIKNIIVTPVNVPLEAPILWSWGIRDQTNRTIVQIETDIGLTGLGETFGGDYMPVLIQSLKNKLVGEDPFNIERILAEFQMTPYFTGYAGRGAICAVEMACWDLMGKYLNLPLYKLLGGSVRKNVEFAAFIFARKEKDGVGGEDTPEKIAQHCLDLKEKMGFKVYKLKGGVSSPDFDLETMGLMDKKLGKDVQFRFDPNAVWSVETTLNFAPKFLKYNIQYLEDLVWGLEASARVRRELKVPIATNMFVVCLDDLPLNARLNAFDVILGDVHKWGGITATKKQAAVCEVFGWGMSMHSGAELGISTAATLHVAASTPQIYLPLDTHYYHLVDDVIKEKKFEFNAGCLVVPDKPGLGVELNLDKLEIYHEKYINRGAIDHAAGIDGDNRKVLYRPQW